MNQFERNVVKLSMESANDYLKYKPNGGASSVGTLAEPAVAYGLPAFQDLAGWSRIDVEGAHLSGRAVAHLQEQMFLTSQALSDVMGISKSKYYELLKQPSIDASTVDALVDFSVTWQKGLDAFDGDWDLFMQWLSTQNENLGGIEPVSLINSRLGRRELEKAFARIEYSIYG